MAGGRPTLYNEAILTKTQEYISSCNDGYEVIERPNVKDGRELGTEAHRIEKVKLPTIEGLAVYLDINKDTIYTWRKEYEEFSDLIDKLLAKQANMLISKGLSGDYNTVIAKVLLTKHGYNDRVETDVTTKGESINMSTSEAIKIAKEYESKLKGTL